METLQNPFRAQMHAFGERVLAAHKQIADWQIAQMKLAEKQMTSSLEAARAGYDAGAGATLAVNRTLLDAFFPAETSAA